MVKFLLSVSFCLNLFLGYYFVYKLFFEKKENNDNLINKKEIKIIELDKINKEKQLVIDSLEIEINKMNKKTTLLDEKIRRNKKYEETIKIRRIRVNNDDDTALIRELSEQQID
jgi:hypothetical protein